MDPDWVVLNECRVVRIWHNTIKCARYLRWNLADDLEVSDSAFEAARCHKSLDSRFIVSKSPRRMKFCVYVASHEVCFYFCHVCNWWREEHACSKDAL